LGRSSLEGKLLRIGPELYLTGRAEESPESLRGLSAGTAAAEGLFFLVSFSECASPVGPGGQLWDSQLNCERILAGVAHAR
jgi:hypothetical protein